MNKRNLLFEKTYIAPIDVNKYYINIILSLYNDKNKIFI